jgi:hypothetical protein
MSDQTPDMPPEVGTDPRIKVVREEVRAAQVHVEASMRKGLFWSDVKSMIIAVGAVGSVLLAGFSRVEAWAQDKVDGGVKPVREQLDSYKAVTNSRLDRMEKGQDRVEAKVDRMLEALHIPNPAPAPKDGGP